MVSLRNWSSSSSLKQWLVKWRHRRRWSTCPRQWGDEMQWNCFRFIRRRRQSGFLEILLCHHATRQRTTNAWVEWKPYLFSGIDRWLPSLEGCDGCTWRHTKNYTQTVRDTHIRRLALRPSGLGCYGRDAPIRFRRWTGSRSEDSLPLSCIPRWHGIQLRWRLCACWQQARSRHRVLHNGNSAGSCRDDLLCRNMLMKLRSKSAFSKGTMLMATWAAAGSPKIIACVHCVRLSSLLVLHRTASTAWCCQICRRSGCDVANTHRSWSCINTDYTPTRFHGWKICRH